MSRAGFGFTTGKGDKVKRVLANRQSAQRSRIRKLAHIEDLMHTAQMLQNDINKLGPQLHALNAKQAGKHTLHSRALCNVYETSRCVSILLLLCGDFYK